MNLNIIGNGFDLFHGLPSSYYYFGCYLIENENELYNYLGDNYDFKAKKVYSTYPEYEYDNVIEDMFWKDFENKLGNIEESFVFENYSYDLGLENDDPVELEMDDDKLADRLKSIFSKWVTDTLDKDVNYNLIKAYQKELPKFYFGRNNKFLVFNYTHTLQRLYKISDSNIHYVHGECLGTEEDELIIGHANNNRIKYLNDKIEDLENNFNYTQKSQNRIDEHKCLLRYIENLKKDVSRHMFGCSSFYRMFKSEPKRIKVFGMSMGTVDIPYLLQIRSTWPNSKWDFSYYSASEKKDVTKVAKEVLGLKNSDFTTFEFSSVVSYKIMKEIVKINNIIEYTKV